MIICSPHVSIAPESSSGGEVYEREVLKHVALLGVRVDIILPGRAPCWNDVPNWHIHRTWLPRGFRWYVSNLVFPRYIKQVYDQQPFDLLRVHSLRFVGPAALWARRRYRLPVPVVAHHHHLDRNWLNPVIERRVIEACDLVTTDSQSSREQLARELQVDTSHVAVVYAGIAREFEPQPKDERLGAELGLEGRKILLFLGGLKPRKNVGLLLDVFRNVVAEMGDDDALSRSSRTCRGDPSRRDSASEVRLLIAGSGGEEKVLRRRAGELGLADKVVFAGYVPEADKVRFYNLADVYVHPSSLEGFGMTAGEAMSCGKPVVATAVGSLPEVVADGETGFLVPLGDRRQFAERIVTLLQNDSLARQLGEAGRRRVEALFRWEMVARRLADLYQQVLSSY
jgi:glycosyltransferase involved in cell wall biosynthesis